MPVATSLSGATALTGRASLRAAARRDRALDVDRRHRRAVLGRREDVARHVVPEVRGDLRRRPRQSSRRVAGLPTSASRPPPRAARSAAGRRCATRAAAQVPSFDRHERRGADHGVARRGMRELLVRRSLLRGRRRHLHARQNLVVGQRGRHDAGEELVGVR